MLKKITAILSLIALLAGVVPVSGFAMTDSNYAYVYVAPDGNDDAEGTVDSPLATIGGARDKIRELKAANAIPAKGAIVYFRGGDYNVNEGTTFTSEDSGREGAPIVYRSYPGERATFVGGISLNVSDMQKVTDSSILDRLADQSVRDQLYSINLRQQGIYDLGGELYLEGGYSYNTHVDPPHVKPSTRPPEFFVDGQLMKASRYPNDGYMTIKKVVKDPYVYKDNQNVGDYYQGIEITSDDKRYLKWTNAKGAAIYGYWYYDWADSSMIIDRINVAEESIITKTGSYYGTLPNQRFYAYNLLEEIDVPGEYYTDRERGIIYIYPPKNVSEIKEIRLSLMDKDIVTFDGGASYIDFKDMKFTACRKSAFVTQKADHINIIGCEIEFTAEKAINIWDGTRDSMVKSCYIHDVNGGIRLRGGIYDNLEAGNNVAENNHITRFSRLTKTYNGAVEIGAIGNIARHNEMHDGPHLAVQFYGQDNRVEYNNIYNVVKESDDAAAVYGGQTILGRGLQVRYNYFHDIRSDSGQGVGRAAVYLDGGQNDVTMMGNVVYNIEGHGFWPNGGQDNNIYNNIFINIDDGAVYFSDIMSTGVTDVMRQRMKDSVYKSTVWTEKGVEHWKSDIWRERYPELIPQLESPDCFLPLNCMMYNNLVVNSNATKWYGNAASYLNMSDNWVTKGDPGFYDMVGGNFLLKPDSEVFERIPGFEPLPFTRMGRYDERALHRVKDSVVLQVGSPFARSMDKDTMIDKENMSVVPVIEDDKTLVPVRFISEAVGGTVDYNDETKKITIVSGANTLELTIDSMSAKKNGEAVELTKAPVVKEGRTLLPLRDVAELLGKQVYWHDSGLITISDNAELYSAENDKEIILYLHDYLTIH